MDELRQEGNDAYRAIHPNTRRGIHHASSPAPQGENNGKVTNPPILETQVQTKGEISSIRESSYI